MGEITKIALKNALATASYVALVGLFMYFGSMVKVGRSNVFLVPIAALLLLVFSAALTGFIVFGKPAQMYIDGKKKEALAVLTRTLEFFFGITLAALVFMTIMTR